MKNNIKISNISVMDLRQRVMYEGNRSICGISDTFRLIMKDAESEDGILIYINIFQYGIFSTIFGLIDS